MPAPLDVDLRIRAVQAYLGGDGTIDEVALRFCVGTASLKRWVRLYRTKSDVEPKPAQGGRPFRIGPAEVVVLRDLVAEQPDVFCWELAERLAERTGVSVDEDTIGRALRRLDITRKKKRSSRASS